MRAVYIQYGRVGLLRIYFATSKTTFNKVALNFLFNF